VANQIFRAIRAVNPHGTNQRELADAINQIIKNFPQFGYADYRSIKTFTAAHTFDADEYTILADVSATASMVITLPPAATSLNRVCVVKKIDSTLHPVTVDGNASELVEGSITYALSAPLATVTLHCDGTQWWALSWF
jgi:hypothetical protein